LYHDLSKDIGPQYTRRPNYIPPYILNAMTQLPAAPVLDDRGDAFERIFLPDLIPKVVRHKPSEKNKPGELGDVDYTAVDWSFTPFTSSNPIQVAGVATKKKTGGGLGLAATKTKKEKENVDIGWRDIDDGTWTANDGFEFEDGGYVHAWGGTNLWDKELSNAEPFDVSNRLSIDSTDSIDRVISNEEPSTPHKESGSMATHVSSASSSHNSISVPVAAPAGTPVEPIKEIVQSIPSTVETISAVKKLEHMVEKSAGRNLPPITQSSPRDGELKESVSPAKKRRSKDSNSLSVSQSSAEIVNTKLI
jgi:hypothetical protein